VRRQAVEIRFLTAASHDGQSADAVAQRHERAYEIADICHNRPQWLDPHYRSGLADGFRRKWRTSNTRKRRWLQSRWDQIGYNHRWLTNLPPEAAPPRPSQPEA
jgi:hypothetical protein